MILKGKSKDGSDAEQIEGVFYTDPNDPRTFGNFPFTKEQEAATRAARKNVRMFNELRAYMGDAKTLADVCREIEAKECRLTRSLRAFALEMYDEVRENMIASLEGESELDKQVGCGYCTHELTCKKRDSKINKAKEGCQEWLHFAKDPNYGRGK